MNFLHTIKRQSTNQTNKNTRKGKRAHLGKVSCLDSMFCVRGSAPCDAAGRRPLLQVAHLQFAGRHDGPGRTSFAQTDAQVLGEAITSLPSGIWTAGKELVQSVIGVEAETGSWGSTWARQWVISRNYEPAEVEQGPREGGDSLQEGKMRSLSPIDLNPCLLARSRPRVIFLINQGEKKGGGRGYVIQGSPHHR